MTGKDDIKADDDGDDEEEYCQHTIKFDLINRFLITFNRQHM